MVNSLQVEAKVYEKPCVFHDMTVELEMAQ